MYMHNLILIPEYIAWHYTRGIVEIYNIDKRLFSLTKNSFSFSLILKTFASPWKRMGEEYKKSDPGSWATTFVFNLLMRVLGMVLRTAILTMGAFACVLVFCVGVVAIVLWIFLPLSMVALFFVGLKDLFV